MLVLLVFLGMVAGAWYLLIVRPQKDQQTRHGRLVERLRVGNHVLTVGGIYGHVTQVDGSSVVLELAPGLTTRITTDGIARIVHGAEAANEQTRTQPPRVERAHEQVTDNTMHQPPHQQDPSQLQHQHQHQQTHPQYGTQPAYAAPVPMAMAMPMPMMPAAQPMPQPVPMQHAPYPQQVQYAPQPPVHLPPPPAPTTTTLRAHMAPDIPTFEPRPWRDAAPVNAPAPIAAPIQHVPVQSQLPGPPTIVTPFAQPQLQPQPQPPMQQQYAPAPVHPPNPAYAMPPLQYAPPAQAPQPMLPAQPYPVQYAPVQHPPVQHAPVQHAPVQYPPVQYASPYAAQPMPVAAPVAVEQPMDDGRRSRAPQGMGSSLRLDDPSIRDTMVRARDERSELAQEYQRLTAPLVDLSNESHPHAQVPAAAHQQPPQVVGYDPNGAPLFAHGAPVPNAHQYPSPARPPQVAGATPSSMPRPVVSLNGAPVDPALHTSAAFQRRTPYAPEHQVDLSLPQPTHA